ncbi:MAG: hypothetical protein PSV17_08540 [Methylotenera sp.]|uniref:hypothetical protein n=1 Tax=Methylotenera sp. TaxID=2051956 RepID=UPI00248A4246|nr:hypothetical protein [Methylotenera sp.]MDI1309465.1 hypothetical protein [Methylotenera sp.]
MKQLFLLILLTMWVHVVQADTAFYGDNFSGTYECKGSNNKVGDYEVMATLKLNPHSSHNNLGTYDITTETENAFIYKGQAIAQGRKLALTFNFSDSHNAGYTTGIADLKSLAHKRWSYKNNYYEPDGAYGVYGSELCVMKKPQLLPSKRKSQTKNPTDQPVKKPV